MHYIAEFSVTMPILSFTATSDLVANGEGTVQIYCVQTQAIQLYALDIAQCLPSPDDDAIKLQMGQEAVLPSGAENVQASFVSDVSTSLANLSIVPKSNSNTGALGTSNVDISRPLRPSSDQLDNQATVLGSDPLNTANVSIRDHAFTDDGSAGPGGGDTTESSENVFPGLLAPEPSNMPPPSVPKPSARGAGEVGVDSSKAEAGKQQPEEPFADNAVDSCEPLTPDAHEPDPEGVASTKGDQDVSNDVDRGPDPTLSPLSMSAQHQSSGPSQLLTPLQLMELTRGSKAGPGSSGSQHLPPQATSSVGNGPCTEEQKLEDAGLTVEVESLVAEVNDFTESRLGNADTPCEIEDIAQGGSSLSYERLQDLPNLNYQTVRTVKQEKTSFVGYEEDVPDEVMLAEDNAAFDEREGANLQARETHETVTESSMTRTETLRMAVPSPPSGASKGRKNKNKATVSPAGISGVSDSQKFVVPTIASTVVSAEGGESAASTSFGSGAFEGLSSHVFAMQDSLNQV